MKGAGVRFMHVVDAQFDGGRASTRIVVRDIHGNP